MIPSLDVLSSQPPFHGKRIHSSNFTPQAIKKGIQHRHFGTYDRIIRDRRKHLKEIATLCEITPLTIYTARHTYATTGKRKGVPTAVIQESMGHATEDITQTYLESFENKVLDDYDELIMKD